MVTGTVSVTDPMAQGGTIALTLPNGSVQTFAYQGGSGSFPVNYSVVSPVGSILSFDAVATSQAGRQSNKSTVSASVIAATYTAELIMPASVALGEFITGTLNISSASTCPANGVVNVCVAGFCDHISIQAVGSYPVNLPYVAFLPSFEMVSASGTVAGQPVDTAVIIEMGGTTPPPLLAPPGDPGPLPPIDSGTPIIIDLPAPPADTPLPDPATPISGGCGLTAIVTTGATVIYPWINNSREGNYPGKYSTPINIKVACGTRPAQGAEVLMRVDMIAGTETYGGHDHGVIDGANKPTGHVLAAFGITDIDGIFSTTYHASEFSGKDEITAVVTHNGLMTTSAPVIVTSKLPNLDPITLPVGSPHQFVGGRCEHYGASTPWNLGKTSACGDATGSSNQYISSSIAQTFYDFLNEYTLLHGAGLYINDASLKFGGMFDVNGGWCRTCSHSTHRIGVDVDFALKDTNASQGTLPVDMPNVWENIVFDNRNVEPIVSNNGKTIKIITPKISYQQHAVGTTNAHVHIFFIK